MEYLQAPVSPELPETDKEATQRLLGALGLVDALTEPLPTNPTHEDSIWLSVN